MERIDEAVEDVVASPGPETSSAAEGDVVPLEDPSRAEAGSYCCVRCRPGQRVNCEGCRPLHRGSCGGARPELARCPEDLVYSQTSGSLSCL